MTEEQILRFFNEECSPQEAEEVIRYLRKHPEVLEQYLPGKEWESTPPAEMDPQFWDELWTAVNRKRTRSVRMVWWKQASVAAAVLLTVGIGISYFHSSKKETPAAPARAAHPLSERRVRLNTTSTIVSIILPDHSTVELSPRSVITYHEPFDDARREIQLDGQGRFRVMQDTLRPFTVYAGGLVTTALGTEFTIHTHGAGKEATTVLLHEGKVVVKPVDRAAAAWKSDVFLKAGQQLVFSAGDRAPAVSAIIAKTSVRIAKKPPEQTGVKVMPGDQGIAFVNSALPDVLSALENYFVATIEYDSTRLSNMNFTGTITKNDSLSIVLKVLAKMNGLELTGSDNQYILRKSKSR